MEGKDILNIIAIVIAPIAASAIAVWLQNRSEKRKDKMYIFKVLMTSRIYGWTPEKVNVLNIIDIVFSDDKKVRAASKIKRICNRCMQKPYMGLIKLLNDKKKTRKDKIIHDT